MAECIANELIAKAITSPKLAQQVSNDVLIIKQIDDELSFSWITEVRKQFLLREKVWKEANIYYKTIWAYIGNIIWDWVIDTSKIDIIKDLVRNIIPWDTKYIDNFFEIWWLYDFYKWEVKNSDIANVIAFDISTKHRRNGFQSLEKYNSIAAGNYWISNTAVEVYYDIMKSYIDKNEFDNVFILWKIDEYKLKWDTPPFWAKSVDEAKNMINNSSTLKELEESFMLSLNYMTPWNLSLFKNKLDSFRFKANDTDTFSSLWDSLEKWYIDWDTIYASKLKKNVERWFAMQWIETWKWWEKWDYSNFLDNAVKLLVSWSNKNSFSVWKKIFNSDNMDELVDIVWTEILDREFSKQWMRTIKKKSLLDMNGAWKTISMSDIIEWEKWVVWKSTTNDPVWLWNTILKYMNTDSKTPPIEDMYLFRNFDYYDINEDTVKWNVWVFDIGKEKWYIDWKKQLSAKIDSLEKDEKLTILIASKRDYDSISHLPMMNNKNVTFVWAKDWLSTFYKTEDWIKLAIKDYGVYSDMLWKMNKFYNTILSPHIPYMQSVTDGMPDILRMAFNSDDKRVSDMVFDSLWISNTEWMSPQQIVNLISSQNRIWEEWTILTKINYEVERSKINKETDDGLFRLEAEKLVGKEISVKIPNDRLDKVKEDYFNYMFAKNTKNRLIAQSVFLKNYNLSYSDIVENRAKQKLIFDELVKEGYSVNASNFDELVNILLKNPSDNEIQNNIFIIDTIWKNREKNDTNVKSAFWLYNHIRSEILPKVNETIAKATDDFSEETLKKISLPKTWDGIGIVRVWLENIPTDSAIYERAAKLLKFKDNQIVIDLDGLWNGITHWDFSNLDNSLPLVASEIKWRLTDLRNTYIWILEESKNTPLTNQQFRELHSKFDRELWEIEDLAQTRLWNTVDNKQKLYGYRHSIGAYRVEEDIDKYIWNIEAQLDTLWWKIDLAKNNIDIAENWVLPNGNYIRWLVVEPWYVHAAYLWKQAWELSDIKQLKWMDADEIKIYIKNTENKLQNMVEQNWQIYAIYNWISDTLRSYGFLDNYMLVDSKFGFKMPKALLDINPSVMAWTKALSMENNEQLIESIYKAVSDMYSKEWYNWIRMSSDVNVNMANLQTIINEKVTDLLSLKYQELQNAGGISASNLVDAYTDVFMPYTSFLSIPEATIKHVMDIRWIKWDVPNISDFMKKYLNATSNDISTIWIQYSENYTKKLDNIIWELDNYAAEWYDKWYSEIFWWNWFTNFFGKNTADILAKQWPSWRRLVLLSNNTKELGKEMSNMLSNIVTKSWLYAVNLWKIWDGNVMYRLDKTLLKESQDVFETIKHMTNEQLDKYITTHKWTADIIAYKLWKFFNAYKDILKWSIDKQTLDDLPNIFLDIWKKLKKDGWLELDNLWNYIEEKDNSIIRKQLRYLQTIWDENLFLWVFNAPHAPENALKNINYKLYNDGKIVLEWWDEVTSKWKDAFNKLFWLNLTESEYMQSYQYMFWWKLVSFWKAIENISSYINMISNNYIFKTLRVLSNVGMNILTAFSTWYGSWLARWKKLVQGISRWDSEWIMRIIWKYWILSEFADMSELWVKQMRSEVNKLWWWNIASWLARSFSNGSLWNTLSLVTTNTNNLMDIMLMWNYKKYAVYQAMKSLNWRQFLSVSSFEKYLDSLNPEDLNKVIYDLRAKANRWFDSVVAAWESGIYKWVSSKFMTKKYDIWNWPVIARVLDWIRQNLSYLNGWWDWIVRWWLRSVYNNVDIAKYLLKNKFSKDALNKVTNVIMRMPEYHQMVLTLWADLLLMARTLRFARTWEDTYEDDWFTFEDMNDSIEIALSMTTLWQWASSSLWWQIFLRPYGTITSEQERQRTTESAWEEYTRINKFKLLEASTANAVWWRLFAIMKTLKPVNYMLWVYKTNIAKWMTDWDAKLDAFMSMLYYSASGMTRYTLSDMFDPSNVSYTTQWRWDIPAIMWWELSIDRAQSYAQSMIDESSKWFFQILWDAFVNSLPMTQIWQIWKKAFWGQKLNENEAELAFRKSPAIYAYMQWKIVPVDDQDTESIKKFIYDDRLTDPQTMEDWHKDGFVKWWTPYMDDGIAMIYEAIWPDKVQQMSRSILSLTKTKDINALKWKYMNEIKQYIQWLDDEDPRKEYLLSIAVQTNLSRTVHEQEPSWNWSSKFADIKYYLDCYNRDYQNILKNNPYIPLDFAITMENSRIKNDVITPWFDEKWQVMPVYRNTIKAIYDTRKAIYEWNVDYLNAISNPLTNSAKDTFMKIKNDDWSINTWWVINANNIASYIIATSSTRSEEETKGMLQTIVEPNADKVIDVFNKYAWEKGWITEAMKDYMDNVFYTENLRSDYILWLQTWTNAVKWGSWASVKLEVAKFEKFAEKLDKIRDIYNNAKIIEFKPKLFDLFMKKDEGSNPTQPAGSYSAPASTSIFGNDITWETKNDIKRTYKLPKQFKIK